MLTFLTLKLILILTNEYDSGKNSNAEDKLRMFIANEYSTKMLTFLFYIYNVYTINSKKTITPKGCRILADNFLDYLYRFMLR